MGDEPLGPVPATPPSPYGFYGMAKPVSPQVTSDEDLGALQRVGGYYKALAPSMKTAAVVQSPDPGDGRQLEYHHPVSGENPVPGGMTFEMFKPFEGKERDDAIAADALHYLGGRKNDDSGPPVDPQWQGMRERLWNSRTPGQRKVDDRTYGEEHEDGQTPEDWAARDRKDAYARAGIWPDRNPDWNRPPGDPMAWTPQQRAMFGEMKDYLRTGKRRRAIP